MKLYAKIARNLHLLNNYPIGPVAEMAQRELDSCIAALPSGSGFDSTPTLDHEGAPDQRYTISGAYRAMDEHGSYSGWIDFTITVFALQSLTTSWDFTIDCPEEHEDYIAETYHDALNSEVP